MEPGLDYGIGLIGLDVSDQSKGRGDLPINSVFSREKLSTVLWSGRTV